MSLPVTVEPINGYWTTIQAIYFSIILIYVVFIIPCTAYYWKIIWSLRRERFFAKRFPRLTITGLMMWNIYLVIFRTIADLPKIIPSFTLKSAEIYIRLAFYNISHTVLVLIFIRFWFLYYNYQVGVQLIFKQFRTRVTAQDHNIGLWTMHYKFLSHKSNTLYYLGLLWVLIVELTVLLSGRASFIIQPLFMLLIFIALLTMGFKIRSCRDKLCIRQECFYIGYTGIGFIICYIIIQLIFDDELKALLDCFCISVVGAVVSVITSKWVLFKSTSASNINTSAKKSVHIALVDIIQHSDAFDLFAIHCVKELSIENLLFLFEIMKFKNECNAHGFIDDDEMGLILQFPNKTGDIIRARSRVNSVDDFEYNLRYIYRRYLDPSSEFAVNISYATRAKIQEKLGIQIENLLMVPHSLPIITSIATHSRSKSNDNDQKDDQKDVETNNALEYIQMLNEAMCEVYNLLQRDSLLRFSQTTEFKQIFES